MSTTGSTLHTDNDFHFSTRLVAHNQASSTHIHELTVRNAAGFSVTVLSYGATIVSVKAPDNRGKLEEITLNYRGDTEIANDLIGWCDRLFSIPFLHQHNTYNSS